MYVPEKFRENSAMRFWVTVRKLNVTDGRTDGRGALQYLPSPGLRRRREIKMCIFGYSGGGGGGAWVAHK